MPGPPIPSDGADVDVWGVELNNILAILYDASTGTIHAHNHAGKWQRGVSFPTPVSGDATTLPRVNDAVTALVVRAYRKSGGTGATIDVLLNGTTILTTPLSLTSTATWMTASISGTPTLAAGDTLTMRCTTVTGAVDEIVIVLDGAVVIT